MGKKMWIWGVVREDEVSELSGKYGQKKNPQMGQKRNLDPFFVLFDPGLPFQFFFWEPNFDV
jgi:hypothetical protein